MKLVVIPHKIHLFSCFVFIFDVIVWIESAENIKGVIRIIKMKMLKIIQTTKNANFI